MVHRVLDLFSLSVAHVVNISVSALSSLMEESVVYILKLKKKRTADLHKCIFVRNSDCELADFF